MHLKYAFLMKMLQYQICHVKVGLLYLECIWRGHKFFFGLQLSSCQV